MRAPVSASSWLNARPATCVADVSFTGTVTSPKLIDPVQMVVGTGRSLAGSVVAHYLRRRGRSRTADLSGTPRRPHVEIEGASSRCRTSTRCCTPPRASRKPRSSTTTPGSPRSWSPTSAGRPVTLVRVPDGVEGERFFEKRCPPPARLARTVPLTPTRDSPRARRRRRPRSSGWPTSPRSSCTPPRHGPPSRWLPTGVVFDLDPGAPAPTRRLRAHRARAARSPRPARPGAVVKTSGSKGLHLSVPIRPAVDADDHRRRSRSRSGKLLESRDPNG